MTRVLTRRHAAVGVITAVAILGFLLAASVGGTAPKSTASIWREIHVKVVEGVDRRPVPSARVSVRASDGFTEMWSGASASTDSGGEVELYVPWYTGRTTPSIEVRHPGYLTATSRGFDGGRVTVNVVPLGVRRTLPVTVRTSSGVVSWEGAPRSQLLRDAVLTLTSGRRGGTWRETFKPGVMPVPPLGVVRAVLACRGHAPVHAHTTIPRTGPVPALSFEQPRVAAKRIVGRVVTEDGGEPIPGAKVRVMTWRAIVATAGSDGTFELPGIDPASFMQGIVPVFCTHDGYAFRAAGVMPTAWSDGSLTATVELRGHLSAADHRVQLRLPSGAGAKGAHVMADVDGTIHKWRADADGNVQIPGWLSLADTLVVAFDDTHLGAAAASEVLEAGSLELRPLRVVRLTAEITNPTSQGELPNVEVAVASVPGSDNTLWFLPVREGGLVSGPAPEGPNTVVSVGSFSRFAVRMHVSRVLEESPRLRLDERRLATQCSGTVVDGNGRPVRMLRMLFTVKPEPGLLSESYVVTTDESGVFGTAAPAGPYRITFPRAPNLVLKAPTGDVMFASGTPQTMVVVSSSGRDR